MNIQIRIELIAFLFYLSIHQSGFCFFNLGQLAQYYHTTRLSLSRWPGEKFFNRFTRPRPPQILNAMQNAYYDNPMSERAPAKAVNRKSIEEGSFCRRTFDNRSGYCLPAHQCLHIVREYRLHGTRIDVCTYRRNIPIICCPLAAKDIDDPSTMRISARKCLEYQSAVRGTKFTMLRGFSGKYCVGSIPMIVGGEITQSGEYPHMTAVGWSQPSGEPKWACGGSLISEQYIITAAHCTESGGKPPDIVRLGAQNLNFITSTVQDIKISIIILHPKYRPSLYYNDIALLKLARPATITDRVQPGCLWQLPIMNVPRAIAVGWGRTEFLGEKSDELMKVDLDVIDQKICRDIYQTERRLSNGIIDEQFCAGYLQGGKDTCQGDSGGPLHAELQEFNCVKFIIGITSFGKYCAAPNAPGVYTNVYSYLDWIEKIVFR